MKLSYISYIRVTAMLMVVFYHCICFYTERWGCTTEYISEYCILANILNRFDMSMFVFISGYLYGYLALKKDKYTDSKAFLINKAKRLLGPYLFWGLLMVVVSPTLYEISRLHNGIRHLWFLLMLFMIFTIVTLFKPLLLKKNSWKLDLVFLSVVLVILSGIFFVKSSGIYIIKSSALCINNVCFFLPYFLIGIYIAKFDIKDAILKLSPVLIHTITLILIVSISITCSLQFTGSMYITNALLLLFMPFMLTSVSLLSPDKPAKLILLFDSCSMGIYILHHIFIEHLILIDAIHELMLKHYIIMPIVLFFSLTTLSCIITKGLEKAKVAKYIFG